MSEDFRESMISYLQRFLPLLSSLVLLLFSYAPMDFLFFDNIRPAVPMVCVYFWMIHRPDLFNLLSVFILGVTDDVISNVPFGTNILVLLVLYVLVNNLSRFFNGKPFIVTWYGFALLSLMTFLTKWFILSIYYSQFLPLAMVGFSFLVTAALYPLLSLLLAFVQNNLIADEEL